MNIQAIETFYKGYRFRSRLEARWAVFFEELGIKWQYEVEGFELPGGRYLPDFQLPKWNMFVEVKPPSDIVTKNTANKSVYMAGRMKLPCYRPFDVDQNFSDVFDYPRNNVLAEIQPREFCGARIRYTGPWRHNGKAHGVLHGSDDVYFNGSDMENYIVRKSMAGIKTCEIFFALFEDKEAFGTLVELGAAHAFGKYIVAGFINGLRDWSNGDDELWFAAHNANKVLSGTREEILHQFATMLAVDLPRELKLANELSSQKQCRVAVVYGDPLAAVQEEDGGIVDYIRGYDDYPMIQSWSREETYAAALKARQARFEFGQTPT